ncbi:hypothetical protein ODV97_18170 [Enterococcus gallinarum]|nr:hypothetical protein [Enterococcus gallinarum]
MWIEKLPNGKFKYFERYKRSLYRKNTGVYPLRLTQSQIKQRNRRFLNYKDKINKKLNQYNQTNLSLSMLYEEWIPIYKQRVKEQTYLTAISLFKTISKRIDTDILIKNITASFIQKFLNDFLLQRKLFLFLHRFSSCSF